MKSTGAKIFFLSLLLLTLMCGGAEAAGSPQGKSSDGKLLEGLPQVTSFGLWQLGANDLMLDIKGGGMPLPQVTCSGNMTEIVLPGVSGENAVKYENEGLAPLVTAVRYRQEAQDFVIVLMTERPLSPKAIRGIPPSDVYTLQLKTGEELQKLVEERVVTDHPQTLQVPTGPFASNDPITLDLRDTELRDVFRMFGQQVKKNIIIHDSMPAVLVTMTFKNSPLSSVFGYLMKTYNLSYEFIDKDTIIVGQAVDLGRISGKTETRLYRIAYADAAALSALLPNLTKATADSIVIDPRLRTLYVTGTPDVHEEVTLAIQKLDNPGKQVMLHARILQFEKTDSLEVERALNAVYDHWAFSYANGGLTGLYADDNRVGGPTSVTITEGSRFIPSGLGTENFNIPLRGIWREFDASFSALEQKNKTKLLANPSVITIDGMEATITLAQEYVYRSGYDDNGNPEYETLEVGPILRMTPKVGRDNTVTLTLDLQTSDRLSSVEGFGDTVIGSANRQVITNVMVRNGEPFVVGGLFREDHEDNVLRIPILGQLPLLGELFSYKTKNSSTTQVVMVVIPYILETPDVAVEYERVMMK